MTRFKLLIEFDGTDYAGWQRQKNGPSIQQSIEEAIFRFCGETVSIVAAGRTDAGVHGAGMVAHADIEKTTDAGRLRDAVNYHLRPAPISILEASAMPDGFHARFSCTGRHYRYDILNRRAPPTWQRHQLWHVTKALDHAAMDSAAQYLVGRHDFSTFRASQCQARSPLKTLTRINVSRSGDIVSVSCHAPSFLHHQVRSFVGSLVQVGLGSWTPKDLDVALQAADRTQCGPVAPPQGLYFVRADYDDKTLG